MTPEIMYTMTKMIELSAISTNIYMTALDAENI